jgi:glycosyltransferase involved in cell wall biosynthesis
VGWRRSWVGTAAGNGVTIVLPTFDRAAALHATLPAIIRMRGVDEIVVVVDGSRDGTSALLDTVADPRLRVLACSENGGAPAARNRGVAAATSGWVVFAEDDCWFPGDYAELLLEEARRTDADVVGAPMVHPRPGEPLAAAVARTRAQRRGDGGLDEPAGFPAAPIETPLLPAPSLVRREVAARVGFDEGYRGVAYREETDFFLRAQYDGARCVLTPATWFAEAGRWPGGQARHWLLEELSTLRGNWRFLRRHRRWLVERGLIASPLREQLAFAGRRARRRVGAARAAAASLPPRRPDPA